MAANRRALASIAVVALVVALLMLCPMFSHSAWAWNPAGQAACNPANQNGRFTGYVVECFRQTLLDGTFQLLTVMQPALQGAIIAAIVLAVGIFGAKMTLNDLRKPKPEALILILKIAAILYFTDPPTFRQYMLDVFSAMEGMIAIMVSPAIQTLLPTGPACVVPTATTVTLTGGGTITFPPSLVWAAVDCAFGKILGFGTGVMLTTGIIGFLVAGLFSGGLGFMIFMIGFSAVVTMFFAVARAVHIFLMAYVVLVALAAVSYLMIPLILFRQTKPYFDKWLGQVISYALQPVMLFGYLTLMLAAFNVVVFGAGGGDPKNSVWYNIAGAQATNPNFNMGDFLYTGANPPVKNELRADIILFTQPAPSDPSQTQTVQVPFFQRILGEVVQDVQLFMQDLINKGIGFFNIGLPFHFIDWDALLSANGLSNAANALQPIINLILSLVTWALLAYIMGTMLRHLPQLAHDLVGTVGQASPALLAAMPLEVQIGNTLGGATRAMGNSASGQRGLLAGGGMDGFFGYAKGVASAPGGAAKGFLQRARGSTKR